jgi:hypothetical protein
MFVLQRKRLRFSATCKITGKIIHIKQVEVLVYVFFPVALSGCKFWKKMPFQKFSSVGILGRRRGGGGMVCRQPGNCDGYCMSYCDMHIMCRMCIGIKITGKKKQTRKLLNLIIRLYSFFLPTFITMEKWMYVLGNFIHYLQYMAIHYWKYWKFQIPHEMFLSVLYNSVPDNVCYFHMLCTQIRVFY